MNLPEQSGIAPILNATRQWVNNSAFYSIVSPQYRNFYQQSIRNWLNWYDGYVPEIHDGGQAILSSKLGATIVNRTADAICGGGIMFEYRNAPVLRDEDGTGVALKWISGDFARQARFTRTIKRAFRECLAGGSSLLKLNARADGTLWIESVRMDHFFAEVEPDGKLRSMKCFIAAYTNPSTDSRDDFVLVEERFFSRENGENVPYVCYRVYRGNNEITTNPAIQTTGGGLAWEMLPKKVAHAIKEDYGTVRINEPQRLPFSEHLGAVMLTATDGVSSVPMIPFGESILANCLTYLYLYDYYLSSLNGDMYIGRGRVLIPKSLQRIHQTNDGKSGGGNWNSGLDSFMYTQVEYQSTEDKKLEPIQFDLRAGEWREIRNNLLESIATSIGLSVSTLASYISDGSNRTAREVSAEETATTLFIEEKRRLLEDPLNELLNVVLHYHGYTDEVEIRWSKAGFTNQSVLVDTLSQAINAGLISQKKAHRLFSPDDDQEQIDEDWQLVQEEQEAKRRAESNSLFGDLSGDASLLPPTVATGGEGA